MDRRYIDKRLLFTLVETDYDNASMIMTIAIMITPSNLGLRSSADPSILSGSYVQLIQTDRDHRSMPQQRGASNRRRSTWLSFAIFREARYVRCISMEDTRFEIISEFSILQMIPLADCNSFTIFL